ncbi:hypothetical protein G7Z17_g6827 [Cylindrodendrum hubeiense]|uniref:Beta-xylosidase C-terminal Concanavalin A-like domain-containing protein n=1 Tax=Cylindrodendrum hubeiense TaxID=595255 RepID=A0A9P5LFX1_9HYPO|nr:hypothetical protein G7Z17_g6827 [Cylindrodendrum hubeiense]
MIVSLSSLILANPLSKHVSNYQRQDAFENPVIYADYPDNDVFRGPDEAYYFSASNMHYSPGAPVLRSNDLVNWEIIGHSVPSLNWSPHYNMSGSNAYIKGTWASTLRYRPSNGLWYWIGCIEFGKSYVYTAPEASGPWTMASVIDTCYYDCGLHIDDDDKMYVVYGVNDIMIAELDDEGLSQVSTQQVLTAPDEAGHLEGNRLYKKDGTYYILNDSPDNQSTYIWKSDSIYGEWTSKLLGKYVSSPVQGGGSPHQGSLIQTPNNNWYFMSFTWAYPAGRMPVLAPIEWGSDGFPILSTVDGGWSSSYPNPLPEDGDVTPWTGTDRFEGNELGVAWEWNHNPDETRFNVDNGLTLFTTTVTEDLFNARNTLTRRGHGTYPVAIIAINLSQMTSGDRCGLAAFRDESASIGVERSGDSYEIVMREGMKLNKSWETESLGRISATAAIYQDKIWLRGTMDFQASGTKKGSFSYSADGVTFTPMGSEFNLSSGWEFFPGYRWAIYNYATQALGGSILVTEFSQF